VGSNRKCTIKEYGITNEDRVKIGPRTKATKTNVYYLSIYRGSQADVSQSEIDSHCQTHQSKCLLTLLCEDGNSFSFEFVIFRTLDDVQNP
jgi:hypothetical protein